MNPPWVGEERKIQYLGGRKAPAPFRGGTVLIKLTPKIEVGNPTFTAGGPKEAGKGNGSFKRIDVLKCGAPLGGKRYVCSNPKGTRTWPKKGLHHPQGGVLQMPVKHGEGKHYQSFLQGGVKPRGKRKLVFMGQGEKKLDGGNGSRVVGGKGRNRHAFAGKKKEKGLDGKKEGRTATSR